MVALATADDLAAVMARDLSASDLLRAERLLDIASAKVRTHTGRTFTRTTTTDTLPVRNRKVRLPQRPVVEVSAVTDLNDIAVTFEWDGRNVLELAAFDLDWFEREARRSRLKSVKVTYEHGYDPVPDDVIGIVCDMTAAALDAPPEQVGVQSESIGPFAMSTGSQFPGGVRLTQSMKDSLTNYITPAGTAHVS